MSKPIYSATDFDNRRNRSAVTIQAWHTNVKTLNPAGQIKTFDARHVEFRNILADGFHFRPSDTLPRAETGHPKSRPDVADILMESIQAARARTVEILNGRATSCFVSQGGGYSSFRMSKALHSHPVQGDRVIAPAVGAATDRATFETWMPSIPKQSVFVESRFSTDSESSDVEFVATQRVAVKGIMEGKVVSRVLIG